ncbi:hypothetical protein O9429_18125, partial [Proteus mirabilis]|uniref:hypothetical protein n=1 Tax=Proteus mirabilis TaxID=584 RepID=UPI0025791FAA
FDKSKTFIFKPLCDCSIHCHYRLHDHYYSMFSMQYKAQSAFRLCLCLLVFKLSHSAYCGLSRQSAEI